MAPSGIRITWEKLRSGVKKQARCHYVIVENKNEKTKQVIVPSFALTQYSSS